MDILGEVLAAQHRIRPYILHTPLMYSHYLSGLCKGRVYLKLENEQHTGSFKARGSLNKVLSLTADERMQGAITASSGNHGLGFARALEIANMKGLIVLPRSASSAKRLALAAYNNVSTEFIDGDALDAELYAKRHAKEHDLIWVSPYNDPHVIGGQGTIGIELAEQLPEIHNVFVTVGGGGLAGGVGTYLKAMSPQTRIIGCLPENSPEMYLWVKSGMYQTVEPRATLSDGSAGAPEPEAITYPLCRDLIDTFCLVPEEAIAHAMRLMVAYHHKIIEGAAAVAVAAFIQNAESFKNQTTVIIICGGNVALETLRGVLCDSLYT